MSFPFDPDWVVAPGETLKEWRDENGLPVGPAAKACGIDRGLLRRIEAGSARITPAIAERLAMGTSIPAFLWLNLEKVYRKGLEEGKVRV